MTDQELERRLRQALDAAAPDDLSGVLSRCVPGQKPWSPSARGGEATQGRSSPPASPWSWWAEPGASFTSGPTLWPLWSLWTSTPASS